VVVERRSPFFIFRKEKGAMARKRGQLRRDAAAWQGLMEQQAASGLSRKAFCERQGIVRSSFESWRRRLASRSAAGGFVELTAPGEVRKRWDVEIELPGGVQFRIRG
jgi:hypothetical protein